MTPKISVITAVYNNAKGIENAVQSVLNQNYPNLEYIVIDGGSNDGTREVLEKYRSHFAHLISQPDQGIYDALNKGLRLATGDIVGFLHSDDHFASDQVLKKIGEAFASSPIDGLFSDLEYIHKNGDQHQIIRHWQSCPFSEKLLSQGWMPPHPTLYLKKSVYNSVGLFDTNFKIAADYDFVLRVFKSSRFRIQYLPEVTVQMQIGGASNRSLSRIIRKSREDFQIMQKAGYPALWTLLNKNFRKLGQFFVRRNS